MNVLGVDMFPRARPCYHLTRTGRGLGIVNVQGSEHMDGAASPGGRMPYTAPFLRRLDVTQTALVKTNLLPQELLGQLGVGGPS